MPAAAAPPPGGSADLSSTLFTLSSPSGAYGPWMLEDLYLRFAPSGQTGVQIEHRHAADRFNPNDETLVVLDTTHRFSPRLSSYAAVAAGSGAPYPQDRVTGELDLAAGRGIVLAAGGSFGTGYAIGSAQQLTLGLDYYFGDDYASLRYLPAWSRLLGSTQGYRLTVGLGHPGQTTETIRLGGGGENDASLVNPLNPTIVGEREYDAGLSIKHWTGAARGYHLDVSYGTLDRVGGGRIYSAEGVGLGVFFGLP